MKIKHLLPQNKYEKESFLKAFFIYFISISFLISVIFYFEYKSLLIEKKYALFLEMKNYSLTFEGKKFKLDLVLAEETKRRYYELLENEREFYMYIPVPGSQADTLKISYPKNKFYKDLKPYLQKLIIFYLAVILIVLLLSVIFALYTTYPLRKAINILDESIKDIIHDINTPVMSIILNIKLLKMKYKDDEDIKRLELAVKQLSEIYKNLKIALKETEKAIQEIDLKQIIEEELETLKLIYPDVKVNTNLNPVKIKADKNAVERIIFNVLSNAFKHNTIKGWINIKLNESQLIVENSSSEIKNKDKLFDRFYKESQRGIGLGLSIVKKLSEELGWNIKIKTDKDKFKLIISF